MKANNLARVAFLMKCARGALRYHVTRRKRAVYIVSSVRCGSTLLKALLGAAPDVSHFGEQRPSMYPAEQHGQRSIFYASYADLCAMSPKRFIVLKQPYGLGHYLKKLKYPVLPPWPAKVIVLFRNPEDVNASIQEVFRTTNTSRKFTDEELMQFQHRYFRMIGDFLETTRQDVFLTSYEQLVADPITVTREMFRFIGLPHQPGTDVYDQGQASWEWKTDDGGPLIRSRKVVSRPTLAVWRDPDTFRRLSKAQTVVEFEELIRGWQSSSFVRSQRDG